MTYGATTYGGTTAGGGMLLDNDITDRAAERELVRVITVDERMLTRTIRADTRDLMF